MNIAETIGLWSSELVPLISALAAFIYGGAKFFKKGIGLYLQSITMAMGCHALGSLYRVCELLTTGSVSEGFTPAYLGIMGFFIFFIAASYGQLDRIVDDGSKELRHCRYIAFAAPAVAVLIFIPNFFINPIGLKDGITYLLVWIPAMIALYFNLKHAIIPDMDFGFIKAIKPYNLLGMFLGFSELVCMTARNCFSDYAVTLLSLVFGGLCIATMVAAKKGVEKWKV